MMNRKHAFCLIVLSALAINAVSCVIGDNGVEYNYYEVRNSSAQAVEISILILFQNSLVIARTVYQLEPGQSYTEYSGEYGRENSPGIHINTSDGVLLRFTATDENGEEYVAQLLYLREDGEDYPMSFYEAGSYDVTRNQNDTYNTYFITDEHFRLAEEASSTDS